jgi:hypothetical protein
LQCVDLSPLPPPPSNILVNIGYKSQKRLSKVLFIYRKSDLEKHISLEELSQIFYPGPVSHTEVFRF